MKTDEIERIRWMVQTINFYEHRYGGKFEEIVKNKGEPRISDDWKWSREGKEFERPG